MITLSCQYGYDNCSNEDIKCHLCIDALHYNAKKCKRAGFSHNIKVKQTKRMGSIQEVKTYNQTKDAVQGTPNSGAGRIKGDLQISNMAMIECKTTTLKNVNRKPGKESFSIQRKWLDKLRHEAKEVAKEFWYLVFSFKDIDEQQYVVCDLEVINSMIATMKHDREELNKFSSIVDVHKKKSCYYEAKNTELIAENEYLKAQIKLLKNRKDDLNG